MFRFASLDCYQQSGIVGLISAFGSGVLGVFVHPAVRQFQPTTTDSVVQVAVVSAVLGFVIGGSVFLFIRERSSAR